MEIVGDDTMWYHYDENDILKYIVIEDSFALDYDTIFYYYNNEGMIDSIIDHNSGGHTYYDYNERFVTITVYSYGNPFVIIERTMNFKDRDTGNATYVKPEVKKGFRQIFYYNNEKIVKTDFNYINMDGSFGPTGTDEYEYDDKSNPYFYSKRNPFGYGKHNVTKISGTGNIDFQYTYNDKGFPLTMSRPGISWEFTYNCK